MKFRFAMFGEFLDSILLFDENMHRRYNKCILDFSKFNVARRIQTAAREESTMTELRAQAILAKQAALELAAVGAEQKTKALLEMAGELRARTDEICSANQIDLHNAHEKGLSEAFIERLTLNRNRIEKMAEGIENVAALEDPIGHVDEAWVRPNGLRIAKRRVPLGVIGIIYESRPNVTSDAAALCLKSGNAVLLRGGSDAINSNMAIERALIAGARAAKLPEGCVTLVKDTSHASAEEMMGLNGLIDVLIPRGGKRLIHSVVNNARVPVIQTGDGVCHVYVDEAADIEMAVDIVINAKVSRPSVCNAMETLLVNSAIAPRFLPICMDALSERGVELRCCERTLEICPGYKPAAPEDWDTEYNDLILSVRIVDSLDAAIHHINIHGTRHSETIVTSNYETAKHFQDLVDAAAVYVNASTRFTDGGEFGFGAEIGISNQKLHARGPMGLKELTTYKYVIDGDGQTRV